LAKINQSIEHKDGKTGGPNTTNSQNNAGTLNLNTTGPFESPAISKLKKRNHKDNDSKGAEKNDKSESVGVSNIDNEYSQGKDSIESGSLLANLYKDPNVVISNEDVSSPPSKMN
jgi:hypothetical protein